MQHEVMAPTGNRERIELDRAPAPEDTEHGVRSSLERTRRRERVARHEEATCGLSGDPHAEDAIGDSTRLTSHSVTRRCARRAIDLARAKGSAFPFLGCGVAHGVWVMLPAVTAQVFEHA